MSNSLLLGYSMPTPVAGPGRCQEASTLSRSSYIPCNAPAVSIVGWRGRSDTPIRMCAACADHNVRNRGGLIVAAYEPPQRRP